MLGRFCLRVRSSLKITTTTLKPYLDIFQVSGLVLKNIFTTHFTAAFNEYNWRGASSLATSHPLSVADAAVVAVVWLEVWVSSVPPRVHVTLGSGVTQEVVCFVWTDVHVADGHHLCFMGGWRNQQALREDHFPSELHFRTELTFLLHDV